MVNEVPINMGKYFLLGTLPVSGYLSGVQDFYQKGPSITEDAPIDGPGRDLKLKINLIWVAGTVRIRG